MYMKTILILAANPTNTTRLRLDEEIREIQEGLRRGREREHFQLEHQWAVRRRDFYRAILDYQPQIVHFSGHGAGEDGIVLEDEAGQAECVPANVLASMFKLFAVKGVECVVLNACYSTEQARAISQYLPYVIGMSQEVGDRVAAAFAVAFYDAIASGEGVEFAYELGCSVMISNLEHETPVLLKNEQINIHSTQWEIEVIPPNPYQGLGAFGEEDAAFFYGRERFVDGLVKAVQSQPLVGVIGPSGSGKSSVVFAGLIPKLRKEGNWLVEWFRPEKQPFYQLALSLMRQLEPELGETRKLREAAGLALDIQQEKVSLEQVISRVRQLNQSQSLLLIVDQFEELYTLCQDKNEQERFTDILLAAIEHKSLTVVFTLRADFYGYVLSYRPWRDALEQFPPKLLSSMSQKELRMAIELPAQKSEVHLQEGLTKRILDDVGNEPGNLPLLEFALTRLWEKQQKRVLTHQAYEEVGGVKKAIANHAEQVYQRLTTIQQQKLQRVFVQLVRPGEGTEDTRRIATRAEVGEENWGLISYLAGHTARLLVTGLDERSGEDTVEIVHEALIREWQQLSQWMNDDRSFRIWQEQLRIVKRQWEATGRDDGVLLRSVRLNEAENWQHKRGEELSQGEQEFIQASVALQDKEKQKEELRQAEIVRLNKELQDFNRTLEHKVEARTEELQEKNQELATLLQKLRATQAQIIAQEKLASLGALTASIAHEIKNRLNFMKNFAELSVELTQELLEEIENQKDRFDSQTRENIAEILDTLSQNCQKINEHGKRADSIVRGMLMHSRGKTGERQLTNINALLTEAVNLACHAMRAKDASFNITIKPEYERDLRQINVIPQNLSRVFINIINNACYAAHQKKLHQQTSGNEGVSFSPTLSVSTKDLGSQLEIRIRDNGEGIPLEAMDKIFEPFFTTKPPGEGTGLGLSICHDIIVQQHQGAISVETESGSYAEFIITLPKFGS